MANRAIVITRRFTEALNDAGQEAVAEQVQGEATRSGGDAVAAAAQLVAFNAAVRELQRVDTGDDVLTTPSHAMAAALQSYVAQQSLIQPGKTIPLDAGGQEAKYDTHDLLGWIGSFFTWWRKLFPQAWLPAPTSPTIVPDQLRMGVIADWGTGLYGAPDCASVVTQAICILSSTSRARRTLSRIASTPAVQTNASGCWLCWSI